MSNPNFNKTGRARLAVDRYDYQNHISGTSDIHQDKDIALSQTIPGVPSATNVHDVLTTLGGALSSSDSFVSIGKNYDVYQSGVFNSSAPYLDVALNDVLYNTANTQNARIRDGGIIVIRAGTYKIGQTVNIPAGITIMGEGFGTKLVNATVTYGSAQAPMFRIVADSNRYEDLSVVGADTAYNPFLNSKSTVFKNLVISDNYLKPAFLGDVSYKQAVNTSQPLITVERGAGFVCEGVTFIGRTASSVPSQTTLSAISTLTSSSSSYSSELFIRGCEFDGFNQTIKYLPVHGTLDSITFCNNRVRNFGPIGGTTGNGNSSAIFTNVCNVMVNDNHFYPNRDDFSLVWLGAITADSVTLQGKSKVMVVNNSLATYKTSNSNASIYPIDWDSAQTTALNNAASIVFYGNMLDVNQGFSVFLNTLGTVLNFNSGTSSIGSTDIPLAISASTLSQQVIGGYSLSTSNFNVTASTNYSLNTPLATLASTLRYKFNVITSNYTIVDPNNILLVNSSSAPITITLPSVSSNSGKMFIIKDVGGSANLNNITIIPNAGDSTIDGLSSFVISSNWMSISLVNASNSWYIL